MTWQKTDSNMPSLSTFTAYLLFFSLMVLSQTSALGGISAKVAAMGIARKYKKNFNKNPMQHHIYVNSSSVIPEANLTMERAKNPNSYQEGGWERYKGLIAFPIIFLLVISAIVWATHDPD